MFSPVITLMIKKLCSKFLKSNYSISLCILIFSLVLFQSLWEFSLIVSCKYNNRLNLKRHSYAYVLEVAMLLLYTQYRDYWKKYHQKRGEEKYSYQNLNKTKQNKHFYYWRKFILCSDFLGRTRKNCIFPLLF